jgi:hypothetical protein
MKASSVKEGVEEAMAIVNECHEKLCEMVGLR